MAGRGSISAPSTACMTWSSTPGVTLVEVSFSMPVTWRGIRRPGVRLRRHRLPPRDWDRWGGLVQRLAGHLVERYGRDEVATWGFEIWNEPNLEVFWAGASEYFRLYEVSARAIKSVDARLRVGGPATAPRAGSPSSSTS